VTFVVTVVFSLFLTYAFLTTSFIGTLNTLFFSHSSLILLFLFLLFLFFFCVLCSSIFFIRLCCDTTHISTYCQGVGWNFCHFFCCRQGFVFVRATVFFL
jgi:hypothetical protein